MKILVYDVAAEDGGGLFVLREFYREVLERGEEGIQWTFMVSGNVIAETPAVRVLRYDKVKKSWLHRLAFEYLELPGMIKKLAPDVVISLQNMPVKGCRQRQLVYLHQSLQYCPKRFSVWKGGERNLAIRQQILSLLIKNAMPRAEHIFVQTQWIKDATVKWLKRPEHEITVVPVTVPADVPVKPFEGHTSRQFFYPARAEQYKNHKLILDACRMLDRQGIADYEVIFTFKPEDSAYAAWLQQEAEGLPIRFVGALSYERVWDYYSKTVLLFPSYLETCGLPMLEARKAGARILASDMPFSHEALDGYPNAVFFSHEDASALADRMQKVLEGKLSYTPAEDLPEIPKTSLLESMLSKISRFV